MLPSIGLSHAEAVHRVYWGAADNEAGYFTSGHDSGPGDPKTEGDGRYLRCLHCASVLQARSPTALFPSTLELSLSLLYCGQLGEYMNDVSTAGRHSRQHRWARFPCRRASNCSRRLANRSWEVPCKKKKNMHGKVMITRTRNQLDTQRVASVTAVHPGNRGAH